MALNTYPIIGVFENSDLAERAIQALQNAGFTDDQMTYSGNSAGSGFFAGLKSLFTGEDEASPNVVNDLVNVGVPQDQATYYAQEHTAGHPVVTVRADGREQEATNILRSVGGYDYSSRQKTGTYAGTAYDQTTPVDTNYDQAAYTNQNDTNYADRGAYTNQTGDATTADRESLRLREERLQAQKQTVQAGEVRLHKDVVEEEKRIDVPVTHEEVVIDRRPLTEGRVSDTPVGQDETIRIPVSAEQVNVAKTTVETGEVSVGKRAVTENQRVTDTVKHEEARLEKNGDVVVNDNALTNRDTVTNQDDNL